MSSVYDFISTFMIYIAVFLTIRFVIWIVTVVAKFKIVEKAGIHGICSLIPIYNRYVSCKIGKTSFLIYAIDKLAYIFITILTLLFTDNLVILLTYLFMVLINYVVECIIDARVASKFGMEFGAAMCCSFFTARLLDKWIIGFNSAMEYNFDDSGYNSY